MSELDLRALRYFVAVAEEGAIGRAAVRLGVAQPAISRQLKLLERAIGADLVSRHAKGVEPTEAGQALLTSTRGLFLQVDAAAIRATRAAQGMGGSVRLGIGRGSLTSDLVQRVLTIIHEQFPDIELTIEDVGAGPGQWRGLLGHTLDLAIGVEPPPDLRDIAAERLIDARLETALVSSTHPLASRSIIEPGELGSLPMVWVPRAYHPDLYDALRDELARLDIASPIVDTYSGVYAMFLAVAAGDGVARIWLDARRAAAVHWARRGADREGGASLGTGVVVSARGAASDRPHAARVGGRSHRRAPSQNIGRTSRSGRHSARVVWPLTSLGCSVAL